MVTLTRLTPASAQQSLQDEGIKALGLTAPQLSPVWSNTTPTADNYDNIQLTLNFGSPVQAPFLGILHSVDVPDSVYEVDGSPVAGPAIVFRFHPQAAVRLISLATGRYSALADLLIYPVATTMVVRTAGPGLEPQWYEPGDVIAASGTVSFHDQRGLIVDPIAVAAMYHDLLAAFPAMLKPPVADTGASVSDSGGLSPIAALASGTRVHVIDGHGALFQPPVATSTLTRRDADGDVTATLDSQGLLDFPVGQVLRATDDDETDTTRRLRWGWSQAGTLARTPLSHPELPLSGAPPATLPRQFLRVTVIDLPWHLLGNRSTSDVQGIPGDDGDIPASLQPKIRTEIDIDYLSDGIATMAGIGQVVERFTDAGSGFINATSPVLDDAVGVPPAADSTGRWPNFPVSTSTAGFPAPPLAVEDGMTAYWHGAKDVVVTIQDGQVPDGASVRLYPRLFVEIKAIAEQPSFVRGDGGSGIATAGGALSILLENPFNLLEGQPQPSPAHLTMDIVVTPRVGRRRLSANIGVDVSSDPAPSVNDPFATPDVLSDIPLMMRAVCPVPLFGLSRALAPSGGTPATPLDLVRSLASETEPREGPRLPTMARFDSAFCSGIPDAGAVDGVLSWQGVLTGGRWQRETRSSLHREGNPGNPAGPDIHAAGVRVNGDLALDLARHTVKRTQPILPLPSTTGSTPGWIVMSGGNNFNEPSVHIPDTGAGALLETVAAVCETPELSLISANIPDEDVAFQDLLQALAGALSLPSVPDITVGNEDRLINLVRREYFVSKHGTRDALWALRRALGQARELIYIESPQFCRTAYAAGSPAAHEIDLVETISSRMIAQPGLKVVICTSRASDYSPRYQGWVRQALKARKEAVDALKAVDDSRVVAFHPKGFPGRSASIRTSTICVDDIWNLTGTSHFRRRGMTFDGAADIVSLDLQMANGYSQALQNYRRELMARKLGLEPTDPAIRQMSEWTRLAQPASAFSVFKDLVEQGGLGMIDPLWEGPSDTAVLPATEDMADPDGSDGATFIATFASLLAESGD
ncbi:MAG TPA: hypothetical protein ENJ84_15435 [Gammaproteobacteria bacterium]|nr:hypothetical protein [Gammaproteobacteria bacterium]